MTATTLEATARQYLEDCRRGHTADRRTTEDRRQTVRMWSTIRDRRQTIRRDLDSRAMLSAPTTTEDTLT
jgi:hypothetical protein